MLFNVFQRTLEFDEFFSSSSIIASFLALATRRTTLFLATLRDSLRTNPLCNLFFNSSRCFIALRISSESHDGFFNDFTLRDFTGHVDQLWKVQALSTMTAFRQDCFQKCQGHSMGVHLNHLLDYIHQLSSEA